MPQRRREVVYRRLKIVAREAKGGWEARAFAGKRPVSQTHLAAAHEQAIDAVKADIDEERRAELASRESDGFPTAQHVLSALLRLRPHAGQLAMLEAHYKAKNHTLTATQLANAAGKDTHSYANSQYGSLARDLAEEMEYVPPNTHPADGSTVWTFALAEGKRDENSDGTGEYVEWEWTLRPQVVQALKEFGF
ncbi:conserved hypothetical protein [Erythrobacter sp. EC-HK427]|nr:conserved hypothetical protein [Erythrobacter sp. EC-HK427]